MHDPLAAPFEVDHVLLWTDPKAPEASVLADAGFRLDPATAEHSDQGTASRFFSFENAHLELIWIEHESVAPPDLLGRSRWRQTGAPPFGNGLLRRAARAVVPFPTRAQTASWMPPGAAIEIALASDDPAVPYVFPRRSTDRAHVTDCAQNPGRFNGAGFAAVLR
jgi:hypothetical protein